ncbi:glycosyl transferase, group 1 [Lunatimonas lonarensis]|uniref:Glycosyl transferase, group 1 n=1 Tax=Lunatimonas lonarensis TaxID=1232681 RepID=R7ZP42_9BACT|nr:glycosyl transferase, group 1 [Lunatimonas lonarensis]
MTRRFPYNKTEAFLESEIMILSQTFEEIEIFPTENKGFKRKTPSNVKVNPEFSISFGSKTKRILRTITSKLLRQTFWKYRKKISNLNSIAHLFQFTSSVITYYDYFSKFKFEKNDLIYTYWFNEATTALAMLKQTKNFKLIARAHRYDVYEGQPGTPVFWPYRQFTLQQVDKLFTISKSAKTFIETNYITNNKVVISKLGVFDHKTISTIPTNKNTTFVSVSRITLVKRVSMIADVIGLYAIENPNINIRWVHYGDGPERNNLTKTLPNATNLKIELKGNVNNTEIYRFYNENPITAFINLSSSEGIPVSIMEAMSYGIPVIATNVGGNSEIVSKKTGILLSENPSKDEILCALTQIQSGSFERKTIKERWNKNYNAEVNYRLFAEELSNI